MLPLLSSSSYTSASSTRTIHSSTKSTCLSPLTSHNYYLLLSSWQRESLRLTFGPGWSSALHEESQKLSTTQKTQRLYWQPALFPPLNPSLWRRLFPKKIHSIQLKSHTLLLLVDVSSVLNTLNRIAEHKVHDTFMYVWTGTSMRSSVYFRKKKKKKSGESVARRFKEKQWTCRRPCVSHVFTDTVRVTTMHRCL